MDHIRPKPVVLIILDGWGIAPPGPGNAISQANIPYFRHLSTVYPHATITASGEAVGLPRGEVGNTETGHLNLGAGQIVYQDLPRINMAIADGTFFQNPALLGAVKHIQTNKSRLHIMGLVGAGGVHSQIEHLMALIHFCAEHKLTNVAVHAFSDGRDSPPTSGQIYVDQIQERLKQSGVGFIASIIGRYYAMDRDFRWDRTEKAYRALTLGEGKGYLDTTTAFRESYQAGQTDEFIEPTLMFDPQTNRPKAIVQANDAVIFFNYRIDRPRQLAKAFVLPEFNVNTVKKSFDPYYVKYHGKHEENTLPVAAPFERGPQIQNLYFVTMTEYEKDLPTQVMIPPQTVAMPLGRIVSDRGWRQLRASETEKERFVTYYFNGQREEAFPGEDRLMVQSPKVPTYDQQPEMSSTELTQKVIEKISQNIYDLVVMNFPNADMVGHTGNLQAAIKAVETLDQCLDKLVKFVISQGGVCLITADHGNAESMINLQTGEPETEHSGNTVPLIIVSPSTGQPVARLNLGSGILADIAPTILSLLEIPKPSSMSGRSLLQI